MRTQLVLVWGLFSVTSLLAGCRGANQPSPAAPAAEPRELKLWNSTAAGATPTADRIQILVAPGSEVEAKAYYDKIRPNLTGFPKAALLDSTIEDMLAYYGFPAIPPATIESRRPDEIMDFDELRKAVATPEFEAAYKNSPLQRGEIVAVRFFAPKIINVRDSPTNGVPVGGFGWRKVLRFRARAGSDARKAGLDAFYLLFNFTSGQEVSFPENVHAGQIQAILVPSYPTKGAHLDAYFLVYQGLGTSTPGNVGLYLVATFDIAGTVSADDKYFVPRACGQCHGTEVADQKGAKINYLDTDHWIDRTADDFPKVPATHVLVDGDPSYATYRLLNGEIAKQNRSVIAQSGGRPFAALAAEKWLQLHREGQPDEARHVGVMHRGFAEAAGDPVWTDTESTDRELLPLLNQYCFRCHSSVRYHVFEKKAVLGAKAKILARVGSANMPQDRTLEVSTRDRLVMLIKQLP